MSVLQGTSIIWGVSSTAVSGYTAVAGDCTFTAENWNQESSTVELKDEDSKTTSKYWYDFKEKISLTCYPSGSSASAANMPTLGEKVTVTSTDASFSGDWICESISKARKVDGVCEFSLGLTSYEGITPS